jgi:hypothetical protein
MILFSPPFSGIAHNRKLKKAEVVRAIRSAMTSEGEATQIYM